RESYMSFSIASGHWVIESMVTVVGSLRIGATRTDLVEPDPRRFDCLERLLLQFDGARSLGGTGKRAAGDRAMVGAFGSLQILERRRMVVLPLEPACHAAGGFLG